MGHNIPVPEDVLVRLRRTCLLLPEVYEETAWTGVRWRVRGKTIAHVLTIAEGWPPVYAKAAGTAGPVCVLTFESPLPTVVADCFTDPPYFRPPWRRNVVGIFLDHGTDWPEIDGMILSSYRMLAPKALTARLPD